MHIRRWNDAGITRIKRREPSALWIATTHATKLDDVAAETRRRGARRPRAPRPGIAHEWTTKRRPCPTCATTKPSRAALGRRERRRRAAGRRRLQRLARARPRRAQLAAALRRAAGARTPAERRGRPATLVLTVPEPDSVGLKLLSGGKLAPGAGRHRARRSRGGRRPRQRPGPPRAGAARRRPPAPAAAGDRAGDTRGQADGAGRRGAPDGDLRRGDRHLGEPRGPGAALLRRQPPGDDVRPAWRWTRELLVRLGRREARGWKTPDDVIAALEIELPGSPASARRLRRPPAGGTPARSRASRCAGAAAPPSTPTRPCFEPGPPPDPDSPLAYSLEGLQPSQSPDELRARTWWPGWNSNNGLHKFGEELEALGPARPYRRPPAGRRPAGPRAAAVVAPARFAPQDGDVVLVAMHLIYGSEPLSMYTPGVAERAPEPFIGLNEEDAERLEVREGEWLQLWLPWMDARLRLRARPLARPGTAGVPVGLPGVPCISLPARARLARLEDAVVSASSQRARLVAATAWYGQLPHGTAGPHRRADHRRRPDLVRASPARPGAGPLRPQPRRPGRPAAGRRRHLQDLHQGRLDAAVRRPAVFVVAPTIVLVTVLLSFIVVPIAGAGSSPTSTSACSSSSPCPRWASTAWCSPAGPRTASTP